MRLKPFLIIAMMVTSMATFAQGRQVTTSAAGARVVAAGTLVVQGQGEVQMAPDKATVHAGVTTQGQTAEAAVQQNSAAMTRVIAAIESAGIPSEDIQTSNFNVYPQYRYNNGESTLIGYSASNNVRVITRDLESVGSLLDIITSAGATNLNGIYFEIENDTLAKEQALAAAVTNAFSKATVLANAAGVTLGAPIGIDSTNGAAQVYYEVNRGAELASNDSVPVSVGQNTISATVTIVYEIQ